MDGLKRTLALASFEARLSRRMIRVWVLGLLALLLPLGQTAQLFGIYRFASGYNGSWANITRDLIVLQPTFTLGAVLGLFGVFHVFDWRHRDLSRHFAGSLDSSPLTRLQHAWGKFLGFVPALLAPIVVLVIAQVITTSVAGVRVPAQVYLTCIFLLAIPTALTPPALAFGLAGLFRNQALGRALGIAAGVGWLVASFGVGFGLAEKHAVLMGALTDMPVWSDWVGYDWSPLSMMQRAWAFLLAALFVSLAACGPLGLVESARERLVRAAVVGGLALATIGLSAASGLLYRHDSAQAQAVIDAEAHAAALPRLTVASRAVEVDLSQAPEIRTVTTLQLRNDGAVPCDVASLRLNPGLEIASVLVDGNAVQAARDRSVVSVPVAVAPGATVSVQIGAKGRLDAGAIDPRATLSVREASAVVRNNRRLFGTTPAYLTRDVAVLTSDSGFYPDPAMISGVAAPDRAYPDVAPSRMSVTLPAGWTAAGTGRREGAAPEFRFVSDASVSALALCAGRYEEAEAKVGPTTMRLLWHPAHRRNIDLFAPSRDAIVAAGAAKLADAVARTGLPAPAELSIVDVPQLFATYGGTWDSPNRQGQPGLALVKEGSIFGARFDQPLKSAREQAEKGGPASAPAAAGAVPAATAPTPATSASPASSAPPATSAPVATSAPPATSAPIAAGSSAPAPSAPAPSAPAPAPASAPASASEFDPARAHVEILSRFVSSDFTGGALPRLAIITLWDARVKPEGEGLAILGPALSSFVAETALGIFSVDTAESARIINDGQVIGGVINAMQSKRDADIPDIVMRAITDPDDAYAYMTGMPLEKMDPAGKPREWAGVLYIKGRRPLLALRELLGAEAFASVIGGLAGERPLTWSRFREAILSAARPEDQGSVTVLLDNWLSGTSLPGFVVEAVRAFRVQAEPEQWQVLATIRNEGDADGLARFTGGSGSDAAGRLVAVPAGGRIELGMLVPRKIDTWKLDPYLALNKAPPSGTPRVEETAPAGWTPLDGTREAEPSSEPQRVVVDNLDEGFALVDRGTPRAYNDRDEEGEPVLGRWNTWTSPSKWRRWRYDGNWSRPHGTFDATAAVKEGAEGDQPATWKAPLSGTWRAEAWLPAADRQGGASPVKEFEYVVVDASGEHPVKLALDPKIAGWSDLGRFTFAGTAEIRLLDRGDGIVVADAVRFTKESE